jgi:hypothetical protein
MSLPDPKSARNKYKDKDGKRRGFFSKYEHADPALSKIQADNLPRFY